MPHREGGERKLTFFEKGPGPAGYTLPPLVGRRKHAPTHRINPEYSMGLKLPSSFLTNNIGPGPGVYGIPKGTKANGRFIGFEQSIAQKLPTYDKRVIPAPNEYNVPPPNKYRPKAPEYPFGSRTALLSKKISPAPNTYRLPSAIGPKIPDKLATAECTLKGDRRYKLPNLSPGPVYDIGKPELIRPRSAAFTMRIKWRDERGQDYSAGPASYESKMRDCSCSVPKGWHMGIRYNDFTGVFRTQCDKSKFEPMEIL